MYCLINDLTVLFTSSGKSAVKCFKQPRYYLLILALPSSEYEVLQVTTGSLLALLVAHCRSSPWLGECVVSLT